MNQSNLPVYRVKIAESKKIPKNVPENIVTQYDCSTAYRTTILTVFEIEFILDK